MVDASTETRVGQELDDSRAPFMEHLQELRVRLWRAILGVLAAGIICFMFSDALYDFLTDPLYAVLDKYKETLGEEPKLVSRTVTGAFMFHFKAALLGGVFFGVPIILYQFWQFVAPGLYRSERKLALPFVFLSTACFVTGGYFAYAFVLPAAFDFLIEYGIKLGPKKLIPEIAIEDYLGITTKLLLSFGIVFEMPVAIAFLSWVGIVTHRSLIWFWRWAVVLAFVLGAMLTPPDLISQLFLAIPLVGLYGLSIGISYIITKRRELIENESPDDDPDDPDGGVEGVGDGPDGGSGDSGAPVEHGVSALTDTSMAQTDSLAENLTVPRGDGEVALGDTSDEQAHSDEAHEVPSGGDQSTNSAEQAEQDFARRQLNLSLDEPDSPEADESASLGADATAVRITDDEEPT